MEMVALAFFATLIAGLGARDQMLVAGLARGHGGRPVPLLVAAVVAAGATTVWAAWAGGALRALGAAARLAAGWMVLAGCVALLARPVRVQAEPTRSFGATLVALAWNQAGDAARLLVLALAMAGAAWREVAVAGVGGSALVLGVAWWWPDGVLARARRLRTGHRVLGVMLVVVGLAVQWQVRALQGPH